MEAVSIELNNISKTFLHRVKGEVRAVSNVSLNVQPGELLTLLGPSGCGKTTALRMVAGFEQPDRGGRVYIGGEDITDLMANQRNIGFVFQNYALFPHLPIYENVAYGLKVKGMAKPEIDQAVAEVLELLGLSGYEQQFPHQLSGGEQQRVALARAVIIRPRVLLFDEPLSNLDAKLRIHTRSEIRRLQKALSISSIYVTHDQEEAMAISDRIAVMNKGEILEVETAERLYFHPRTEFVAKFIGRINVIPATVKEVADDVVTLEIFGSTYRIFEIPRRVEVQQTMSAFIRPESVQLFSKVEKGHLQGVIAERTFLGEKVDYVVEIDGHHLNATSYDPFQHGTFHLQQKVGVSLNEESIKILKE